MLHEQRCQELEQQYRASTAQVEQRCLVLEQKAMEGEYATKTLLNAKEAYQAQREFLRARLERGKDEGIPPLAFLQQLVESMDAQFGLQSEGLSPQLPASGHSSPSSPPRNERTSRKPAHSNNKKGLERESIRDRDRSPRRDGDKLEAGR